MRLLTLHDILTACQKGEIGYHEALKRAHIDTLDELYEAAHNSGVLIPHTIKSDELHRLARKYCWDMSPADVDHFPEKVLLRVMDFGILEDIFIIQEVFGIEKLKSALRNSPGGALRPRSWSFWHYRLGALIDGTVPAQPLRAIA